MRTAVVESDRVGGRCLNYACIPARAVLRAADILTEIREADEFGLRVTGGEVDYPAVLERRAKVVNTVSSGVSGLFKKNKIDLIEGHGAVTDTGTVRVGGLFDGNEIEAGAVILATGSVKRPVPGVSFGGRIIGTEEAWALSELPARLAVIGAGASGAEIASGFARLGSQVILLEALDRVLPTEDADISKVVERGLRRQGIAVHTSTLWFPTRRARTRASRSPTATRAREVDYLVIAAGRGPDAEGLGLSEAAHRARRARPDRRRRPAAHQPGLASGRSATLCPGRRSRTRRRMRESSPSRTPPGERPTRSSTSTSRAPPSARRTSALFGLTEEQARARRATT